MSSIEAHFRHRGVQQIAAENALALVQEQIGSVDDGHVRDWLNALWSDHRDGPISAEVAAKALISFARRPEGPSQIQVDAPVIKARFGGAQSAAKDDGRDWRLSIDARNVEPRLIAAEADLSWLLSLDLRKPEDFRAFGKWAGWAVADSTYERGSSWSDPTVHHFVAMRLQERHRIPQAFSRPFLEELSDAHRRWVPQELIKAARAALEREAVFDGFLESIPILKERIAFDRLDERTLLEQLEVALGSKQKISPRDFHLMLEDHCLYRDEIYFSHVLQEVTSNRITIALIETGLHEAKIDDAEKIARLEKYFEVPSGGVRQQLYFNGKSAVQLFLGAGYGR